MKKWFILLFAFNLYAIQINDRDIYLGDNISSLDTSVFNVRLDSIGKYKYVAINKSTINSVHGFHNIIIEATPITGIIYQISASDRIAYGYEGDVEDIDSLKNMFNKIVKSLKESYGEPTIISDSTLPFKDFRKIMVPSVCVVVNEAMIIKASLIQQGFFITTEIVYIYRAGNAYAMKEYKVKRESNTIRELIERNRK